MGFRNCLMARDRPHRRMAVSPSALGKVVEVFERNFRDRGELGASVSIWWDGAELLSHGHGWCEREKTREWTCRHDGAGLFRHQGAGRRHLVAGLGEPRTERGNSGARGLAAVSGGGGEVFPSAFPPMRTGRSGQAGERAGTRRGGGGDRGTSPGMASWAMATATIRGPSGRWWTNRCAV